MKHSHDFDVIGFDTVDHNQTSVGMNANWWHKLNPLTCHVRKPCNCFEKLRQPIKKNIRLGLAELQNTGVLKCKHIAARSLRDFKPHFLWLAAPVPF